jgi:hypothetical protein
MRYMSGSWNFSAEGFPERDQVAQLLQSFLEMCPPGARITNFRVDGQFGQGFEVRVDWRVDPPQEVSA